jgi:hypothetical protein
VGVGQPGTPGRQPGCLYSIVQQLTPLRRSRNADNAKNHCQCLISAKRSSPPGTLFSYRDMTPEESILPSLSVGRTELTERHCQRIAPKHSGTDNVKTKPGYTNNSASRLLKTSRDTSAWCPSPSPSTSPCGVVMVTAKICGPGPG